MKKLIELIIAICLSITLPAFGDEVLKEYMLAGKPFKVEKITEEPGKYWVYWGEEKMKWEPKPWMPDYLVKEGPLFYERWNQPDLLYPWNVPLEERTKWDVKEIMNRTIDLMYGWPYAQDHAASWPTIVKDPRGKVRTKFGLEWGKAYWLPETRKQLPESLQGVVNRKFLLAMSYPDDVKGLSILNVFYFDPQKPDEFYIYLPSMRKVRRFSESSRQDYIAGSIFRNEDFVTIKPIHNYKILRTEIIKDPNEAYEGGVYGYRNETWEEKNIPTIHHLGEPCWVIEVTPYREPWWYDKQIWYVPMKSLYNHLFVNYDKKGRLSRTCSAGSWIPHPEQPHFITWQNWSIEEPLTGYSGLNYGGVGGVKTPWGTLDQYFNLNTPELAFSQTSMLQEPTRLIFWK